MKKIIVAVLIFAFGVFIGVQRSRIIEVQVVKKVEVPFLDLTDPELDAKVETILKIKGRTARDINEIEKRHMQNLRTLQTKEHEIYMQGFRAGVNNPTGRW
jgi:hypothetical protein